MTNENNVDIREQVRELAQEVAASEKPSALDWGRLYSRHSRPVTGWHRDFEQVVEQSERSRKELADEFSRVYKDYHGKATGGP